MTILGVWGVGGGGGTGILLIFDCADGKGKGEGRKGGKEKGGWGKGKGVGEGEERIDLQKNQPKFFKFQKKQLGSPNSIKLLFTTYWIAGVKKQKWRDDEGLSRGWKSLFCGAGRSYIFPSGIRILPSPHPTPPPFLSGIINPLSSPPPSSL